MLVLRCTQKLLVRLKQTGDMSAALGAARNLLRSGQAARVKVVKQFLDSATGRKDTLESAGIQLAALVKAPLAPGFHATVFAHPTLRRAVVNLGGIANVSLLEAGAARPNGDLEGRAVDNREARPAV